MKKLKYFIVLLIMLPNLVGAQELIQEEVGNFRGEVIEVIESSKKVINTNADPVLTQQLLIKFSNGPLNGESRKILSDTFEYQAGDKVFINYRRTIDGTENFYISDKDRLYPLLIAVLIFCATVILFGGWQGVRSLVSLGVSLLAIIFVLLPLLLAGHNPILISAVVAGLVLFAAIFFTHGFNLESLIAFSGTMAAVVLTSLLGKLFIAAASLSGFSDESAVYLRFGGGENLDFAGLLLGSIIIGVLGVLDDIAVTQTAIVSEMYRTDLKYTPKKIFNRAMRVGHEHVGALVNTLVLAYTATALPILLLFYNSDSEFVSIINRELFATEIIRTIVGSIGLIATVPLVTALAVKFLVNYESTNPIKHCHSH